ncbi:MAG: hypothetical protein MI919_33985 [Holophagales bacterium]|nr:hypothetical protein [Holophagales bacterium]
MVSQPLQNLLTGLIDYAGLFPPAGLAMAPAIAEHARQRSSDRSWVLGRFVVPVARLEEAEAEMATHRTALDGRWTFSALVGNDPEGGARAAIDAFNARNEGRSEVEAVEAKPGSAEDVARLSTAFAGLEVYHEIAVGPGAEVLIQAVARHGAAAKVRTGGITQEAIPSVSEVAAFLRLTAAAGVAFKATAGLHHPLRGEYRLTYEGGSPAGTMHGFLNVFLAAAFVFHDEIDDRNLEELLGVRLPGVLDFSVAGVSWNGHRLSSEELAAARRSFARSYGSCSFQEPIDDLRRLRLL